MWILNGYLFQLSTTFDLMKVFQCAATSKKCGLKIYTHLDDRQAEWVLEQFYDPSEANHVLEGLLGSYQVCVHFLTVSRAEIYEFVLHSLARGCPAWRHHRFEYLHRNGTSALMTLTWLQSVLARSDIDRQAQPILGAGFF